MIYQPTFKFISSIKLPSVLKEQLMVRFIASVKLEAHLKIINVFKLWPVHSHVNYEQTRKI